MVSIDDFFDGNNDKGSFAANACTKDIDVNEFYLIFKRIMAEENVEDIWILINDIEDECAYSDTAFISTNADKKQIYQWFGEAFPSDVGEVDHNDKVYERISPLREGYKLFNLWWD
ncbi:MAG: hypothetical protein ACOYWZ_11460 [Bacillota bacterium]